MSNHLVVTVGMMKDKIKKAVDIIMRDMDEPLNGDDIEFCIKDFARELSIRTGEEDDLFVNEVLELNTGAKNRPGN